MNNTYHKQVGLLLSVLPEMAKESCFALHGGTAINRINRVRCELHYYPFQLIQ